MAVGLALMMGVRLPLNFNSPYKAVNIIEFWRRWHMTLSRFLRDYLYVPLGGNRKSRTRRYTNLLLTMLLGGLWHGAAWTFVAWGAAQGILLGVERAMGRRAPWSVLPGPLATATTFLVVLLVLGGIGAAGYRPALDYWHQRNRPQWRTDQVVRGDLVAVVNATGQVKPVLSVQVGSFVSGPIIELPVEFNQEVKKDALLARIDPRIYKAQVDQETAILNVRKAEVKRVEALLQQARNDEQRGEALRERNADFLSDAERDQLKFNRLSLEAQLQVAEASVMQAEASLENAQTNLDYTDIKSPVDGIVIDRKIDPGQTLAAQFQTPQLFVVAPQMREKMHVHALIDEADIGLIPDAGGTYVLVASKGAPSTP